MSGEGGRDERAAGTGIDPAEFQELVEQMERAHNEIEAIVNRMNTLVHLLDILNKRVDRLESKV